MRDLSFSNLQHISGGFNPADAAIRSIGTITSAFGYMGGIRAMQLLGAKSTGTVDGATTAAVIGGIATQSTLDDMKRLIDQRISSSIFISLTCGAVVGVAEGIAGAAMPGDA